MKPNFKIIKNFILFFFLFEANCAWITSASLPYYMGTGFKIPDGTPIFQQGYRDGCSTVLYSRGNDFYRSRYHYRYDPNLIGSAEYRFGHQRGYTFCFQTVVVGRTGPFGGSGLDSIYPWGSATGGQDVKFSGSVNANGFFGGSSDVNSIWKTVPAEGLDATFNVFQKGTDASGKGGGGAATPFGGNVIWSSGTIDQIF